jgi:Spy/CpxP family protein refolding chaperone
MTFSARRLLVAVVLIGFAAAEVRAGQVPTQFIWWRSEQFKKELGLTTDQLAKIDKIHQSMIPELRQEWDELNKYESKLSKLIETSTDEAVLTRQIDRVETARANLNKTRSLMVLRMRAVLTPEQIVRFKALYEERERQRHSGSPDQREQRPRPDSGTSKPGSKPGNRPGC